MSQNGGMSGSSSGMPGGGMEDIFGMFGGMPSGGGRGRSGGMGGMPGF